LYDLEGVLGNDVISFVESHVGSLLAWDIAVCFHRNPEAKLTAAELASKLGRQPAEVESAACALHASGLLGYEGGRYSYKPDGRTRKQADLFADACGDRNRRLAMIALVLHSMGTSAR